MSHDFTLALHQFLTYGDASTNFDLARQYHEQGQTAPALGFYLRAAALAGEKDDPTLSYNSLLLIAECIRSQSRRGWSEENALLQAVSLDPSRPEAYWLLSCFYEREQKWQESYTFAKMAEFVRKSGKKHNNLLVGVKFKPYSPLFQVAVAAYWVGRRDESRKVFKKILGMNMNADYERAVFENLNKIGTGV